MTPKVGQHVKCILRNGALAEGIVDEWYNNIVVLQSLDGESVLIITHPAEDIMLIKILLDRVPEELSPKEPDDYGPTKEDVDCSSFEEPAVDYNKPDELKSLAELRIEKAKQERRIIAEKLKEHRPSIKGGKVEYGYPGLGKKPRPQ